MRGDNLVYRNHKVCNLKHHYMMVDGVPSYIEDPLVIGIRIGLTDQSVCPFDWLPVVSQDLRGRSLKLLVSPTCQNVCFVLCKSKVINFHLMYFVSVSWF